jgi:hypothetical protein
VYVEVNYGQDTGNLISCFKDQGIVLRLTFGSRMQCIYTGMQKRGGENNIPSGAEAVDVRRVMQAPNQAPIQNKYMAGI